MSLGRKEKMVRFFRRNWFWMLSGVLVVTAIWQVFLIFENPLVRNNREAQTDDAGQRMEDLLDPKEIYVTLGGQENGAFVRLLPENDEYVQTAQDMMAVLRTLLNEGEVTEVEISELPKGRLMGAMKLSFEVKTSALMEAFQIQKVLPEMMISTVYLCPSIRQGDMVEVYLLDEGGSRACRVQGGERELESNLALYADLLKDGSMIFAGAERYIEAGCAYENVFSRGVFAREVSDNMDLPRGSLSSAFRFGGVVRLGSMNAYALRYFEYPDAVSHIQVEDYLVFSNEKITIRLTEDGFMQYVQTPTDAEKYSTDVETAYQLALQFLKSDMAYAEETNLTPVLTEYTCDGIEYTFYFDYEVNGIPLDLAVYPKIMSGASHAAQVTVMGNMVREAKRWVLRIDLQDEVRWLRRDWLQAADRAVSGRNDGTVVMTIPEVTYYYSGNALLIAWRVLLSDGSCVYISD